MSRDDGCVVLLSGGMDSRVVLELAHRQWKRVEALGFDYGQMNVDELGVAEGMAKSIGVPWRALDLKAFGDLASTRLTGATEATDFPDTFVPGRNIVFLALAGAYAVQRGFSVIGIGSTSPSPVTAPDSRAPFLTAMGEALRAGLAAAGLEIWAPLLERTKVDIWRLARELGIDHQVATISVSCYSPPMNRQAFIWGEGCGTCAACLARGRSFVEAFGVREGV